MERLRRILRYVHPYWHLLVIGVFLAGGTLLSQLAFPWILRFLIDDVLHSKRRELLGLAVGLLIIAAAGTVVFRSLEKYVFTYLGGCILSDIRTDIMTHLRRLPLRYFQDQRGGWILSLLTNDALMLSKFYEAIIGQTIISTLRFIFTLLILIVLHWRLSLLVLLAIPLYTLLPAVFNKYLRQAGKTLQQKDAEISADLQESIAATREIKAFNREQWDVARLSESFHSVLRLQLRLTSLQSFSTATYLVFWIVAGTIYWVGGMKVLRGEMTLGLLIATVGYFTFLEEPVGNFIQLNSRLQSILGAADRIFEFLDTPTEVDSRPTARALRQVLGRVDFENVSFTYQGDVPVLSGITFTVYPGQRVALVGPSGSGKSTLVSLILRLHEPTYGRILIDGQDIREVTIRSLRNFIGVVFQESFLFAASIRENIRFGNLEASDEDIVLAAKAANAHEFILRLPRGYDTEVGEYGVRLSVGQRQRIAIARVLLRNPRILILDEATSALDSGSERAIWEALERLMNGRTTFIITHRLSAVREADIILVLDRGRIIDRGTHEELLKRCRLYHNLYRLQSLAEENHLAPRLKGEKAMAS